MFCNVNYRVVKACVDILYGKEVTVSVKDKNRVTFMLSKLGVKWQDQSQVNDKRESTGDGECHSDQTKGKGSSLAVPPQVAIADDQVESLQPIPLTPPALATSLNEKSPSTMDVPLLPDNKSLHEELEEFTITDDAEVKNVWHKKLFERRAGDPKYECLKCGLTWLSFHQADHHHLEHEFEETRKVRETLKAAELERAKYAKTLSKIRKVVGKTDKKKLLKLLNNVIDSLEKQNTALHGLSSEKTTNKLNAKRAEFVSLMTKTLSKAAELKLQLS